MSPTPAIAFVAVLVATQFAVHASTIVNVNSTSTQVLNIAGTAAEFRYTSGPASGGKSLSSQQYFINGVSTGQPTVTYQSGTYTLTLNSTIPLGNQILVATLDLSTAVQTAMALNQPEFLRYPKSFTTDTKSCSGGIVGPASEGFGGNCRIDPFTNTATGLPARLNSITIGSTTYTYVGGANIPTLGQINLGALNPQFLVELAGGAPISLSWIQLVTLSGSLNGAQVGDNMLCKLCTVFYRTTSSGGQSTQLNALFRATYNDANVPEPSTFALSGAGLLIVAWRLRRRK